MDGAATQTAGNTGAGLGVGHLILLACRWFRSEWMGAGILPACVCSRYGSARGLGLRLGEVHRVLTDGRETPGIISPTLGSS